MLKYRFTINSCYAIISSFNVEYWITQIIYAKDSRIRKCFLLFSLEIKYIHLTADDLFNFHNFSDKSFIFTFYFTPFFFSFVFYLFLFFLFKKENYDSLHCFIICPIEYNDWNRTRDIGIQ